MVFARSACERNVIRWRLRSMFVFTTIVALGLAAFVWWPVATAPIDRNPRGSLRRAWQEQIQLTPGPNASQQAVDDHNSAVIQLRDSANIYGMTQALTDEFGPLERIEAAQAAANP